MEGHELEIGWRFSGFDERNTNQLKRHHPMEGRW